MAETVRILPLIELTVEVGKEAVIEKRTATLEDTINIFLMANPTYRFYCFGVDIMPCLCAVFVETK
jgi:hypothetical protein